MRIVILFLAIGMLVAACNSSTGDSGFAGTFKGDGVTLVLNGSGADFAGELTVDGTTYPTVGKATGTTLSGSFKAGDDSFDLEATLNGATLELVSGGKSYSLTREGGSNPLADKSATSNPLASPTMNKQADPTAPATSGFSGEFAGSIEGTPTSVSLQQTDSTLSGVIDSGGYKYEVQGTVSGDSGSGTLNDPQAGAKLQFTAKLAGNEVVFTLKLPNGTGMDMRFLRKGASGAAPANTGGGTAGAPAAAAASGGEHNPALVGTWSKTTSMSGGGASFASKEYLRITAQGQFQLGSGKAVAGGAGWSMGSGDGVEITAQGQWKTEGNIILVNEGAGWQQFARYYIEASKLMFTLGDGSRQIWYRE